MAERVQTYKNHARFLPVFHFFVIPVLFLNFVNTARLRARSHALGDAFALVLTGQLGECLTDVLHIRAVVANERDQQCRGRGEIRQRHDLARLALGLVVDVPVGLRREDGADDLAPREMPLAHRDKEIVDAGAVEGLQHRIEVLVDEIVALAKDKGARFQSCEEGVTTASD